MTNIFKKTLTVGRLVAVAFGTMATGIETVSAADGEHKTRYDNYLLKKMI